MSTTLTAKEDIRFTFGEVSGGWTFAHAGQPLWLVEDLGDTLQVKNADGDVAITQRDKVQFS